MPGRYGPSRLLRYALAHPVGRRKPVRTLARIMRWQMKARLHPDAAPQKWIGGAQLLAKRGMTGATGNLYFGLHEFSDMAFMLHLLRAGDLFVDVGANVGSYVVLAAHQTGAQVVAFEPDAAALEVLAANCALNQVASRVRIVPRALSAKQQTLWFSTGQDTVNHVLDGPAPGAVEVEAVSLDSCMGDEAPLLIKIDVEGYEPEVMLGAEATLAKPDLRAIEIETVTPEIAEQLSRHGFVRRWYDPFKRSLSQTPVHAANNALYVRDESFIMERLRSAPAIDVFGLAV